MNITPYPGIYVHIPFCQVKCGYCDFYSETTLDLKKEYLQSLFAEIRHYQRIIADTEQFDTLYIGGGTPSVLEPSELSGILENIKSAFKFNTDSEITLEINPGTIDYNKLRYLHTSGITRLSIGIQSFNDPELKLLGRIHDADQARCTILDAREAGFDSINIDLIYALPNQTVNNWLKTLHEAVQFAPEHISAYNLSYEENTPFYQKLMSGDFNKHKNETEALFFTQTSELLPQAGYVHYEISNYANSVLNLSRHNYKYWNHTPYLSFGPAAHSFWNNRRWGNVRSIKEYIRLTGKGLRPVEFEEEIDLEKLSDEFIMLRLRTLAGIDLNEYSGLFAKNFIKTYSSIIENLIKENFAVIENDHFKLTKKGLLICDEISPIFAI